MTGPSRSHQVFEAMNAESIASGILRPLLCGVAVLGMAQGSVVLNQVGDPALYNFSSGLNQTPSQRFVDFPTYDSAVLEDFTVSTGELNITRISVLFHAQGGFPSFLDINNFTVNIYSDVNLAGVNLIGNIANVMLVHGVDVSITEIVDNIGGEYGLVHLDTNIPLPAPGTYWIGVSPESALSITGQFRIPFGGAMGSVTPGNANAKLANPGEGFGNGTLSNLNQDYAYMITAVPEPGNITLWLLGGIPLIMRRRRPGKSS